MGGKFGTKATVEVLQLVSVITLAIVTEAQKKGWSWSDIPAFLKSPELEAKVKPVVADWPQVLPEILELDIFDDIALGKEAYGVVSELIDAIKKVKPAA